MKWTETSPIIAPFLHKIKKKRLKLVQNVGA